MGRIIAELIPFGFFALVAFIIWNVTDSRRRQEHLKVIGEFNSRLLDRIGSLKEFGEFLQTDGGRTFMESLTVERGSMGPRSGILRAAQAGVVLITLSLGWLFLAWKSNGEPWDHQAFTILGVVLLSLGLGFLLAGSVSYRLGKTLGVIGRHDRPDDLRPTP